MTVLDEIIAGVREDLALREARVSLDQLKERASRIPSARNAEAGASRRGTPQCDDHC